MGSMKPVPPPKGDRPDVPTSPPPPNPGDGLASRIGNGGRSWVVAWRYFDGSSSGVLPWLFSDDERTKFESVMNELGSEKAFEFIAVKR